MGRPKKSETAEISVIEQKSGIGNFELSAEIEAGKLTSNAKELAVQIKNELQNYTVDRYINDPEAAKKDKAVLNKVKDAVSEKRKEVTALWNGPLNSFLDEMRAIESAVSEASSALNEIVKFAEDREKDEKKSKISEYWNTLNFSLVNLDRVFNARWLNKTYKLDQIFAEIQGIKQKIESELETLKNYPEDAETLQAVYLATLDLNSALRKGAELKAAREKIKAAEEEQKYSATIPVKREETPENKQELTVNKEIVEKPVIEESVNDDPVMEYNLIIKGEKSKLIRLRQFMSEIGLTYTKVVQ